MIRGLIFDVNGTVTDILTNEYHDDIYRVLSNFLDYQGVTLSPDKIRHHYFEISKRQKYESPEEYPEFDVVAVFRKILELYATNYTAELPVEKLESLPLILAELFRAVSRFKLELYPDVMKILQNLHKKYQLSVLSDGQSAWAIPELRSVGLLGFFDPIIVSGDLGYRKPDVRMFEMMLDKMKMEPSEVIFIGNDMFRDVFGAKRLGIKTVFFKSNQGDHRDKGADPDYIIYHFSQLPEAIRFLSE